MQLKQNFLKQTANELKLHHTFLSLPRSVFLDVTQRSPKRTFGGALRDIQKTTARETILFSVLWWSGTERYFSFQKKNNMIWCHFYTTPKMHLASCTMKGREVTKNKTHLQESFDTFIPLVVVNLHFLLYIVSHPESPGSSVVLQRSMYLLLLN